MAWINTPEWDGAEKRWCAFWEGELLDRPVLLMQVLKPTAQVAAVSQLNDKVSWIDSSTYFPIQSVSVPVPDPPEGKARWCDPDFLLRVNDTVLPRVIHMGESFSASLALQIGHCPVYGGSVEFRPDTTWILPSIPDWNKAPDWHEDWDDDGWKLLKHVHGRICKESKGRYFVHVPGPLVPNDLLSLLRGAENFMVDLVFEQERVSETLSVMRQNYVRMWNELDAMRDRSQGYGNYAHIWCPAKLRVLQSDVSCMISERMFETFILPELHVLSEDVDHVVYHLDGSGAIRHLEMICSLPKVKLIHWAPDANGPPSGPHWMGLYKKVQSLGKSIWIEESRPQDLETLIQELDPRKVVINTSPTSMEQAREMEKKAVQWTARYWRNRS